MNLNDATPEMIAAALELAEAELVYANDLSDIRWVRDSRDRYRAAKAAASQPWELDAQHGNMLVAPGCLSVQCGGYLSGDGRKLAAALRPILNEQNARIEAALKEGKP